MDIEENKLEEPMTLAEIEKRMEERITKMRADFAEVQVMKQRILNRANH